MRLLWNKLNAALPLILHGDPTLVSVIGFTLQVAAVATGLASLDRDPARARDRARPVSRAPAGARARERLAGAAAGDGRRVPVPAVLGRRAARARSQLIYTRRVVFVAQTVLAMPYTVALTAAAVQALPAGLLAQARALRSRSAAARGAGAARGPDRGAGGGDRGAGTSLSEVAAIVILGGNVYGYNQTLASRGAVRRQPVQLPRALAVAIVLGGDDPGAARRARDPAAAGLGHPLAVQDGDVSDDEPLLRASGCRSTAAVARSCTASTSSCGPASWSRCWDPTAPASRRCSTRWRASLSRLPASVQRSGPGRDRAAVSRDGASLGARQPDRGACVVGSAARTAARSGMRGVGGDRSGPACRSPGNDAVGRGATASASRAGAGRRTRRAAARRAVRRP